MVTLLRVVRRDKSAMKSGLTEFFFPVEIAKFAERDEIRRQEQLER